MPRFKDLTAVRRAYRSFFDGGNSFGSQYPDQQVYGGVYFVSSEDFDGVRRYTVREIRLSPAGGVDRIATVDVVTGTDGVVRIPGIEHGAQTGPPVGYPGFGMFVTLPDAQRAARELAAR